MDVAGDVRSGRPRGDRPSDGYEGHERTHEVVGNYTSHWVHTEFETRLVLKGSHNLTSFTLHHYRWESVEEEEHTANGPILLRIKIQPGRLYAFLLFLRREKGGNYVPVTDQIDSDVFVIELVGSTL